MGLSALASHQRNWERNVNNVYSDVDRRADADWANQGLDATKLAEDARQANLAAGLKTRELNLQQAKNQAVASPSAAPFNPALGGLMNFASFGMLPAGETPPANDLLGYAQGGAIQGPPSQGVDNVPVMAQDGEYVLPPETVQALGGVEVLDKIVAATTGQAPGGQPTEQGVEGFAAGGVINPTGMSPMEYSRRINREQQRAIAEGNAPPTAMESLKAMPPQPQGSAMEGLRALFPSAAGPVPAAPLANARPSGGPIMVPGSPIQAPDYMQPKSRVEDAAPAYSMMKPEGRPAPVAKPAAPPSPGGLLNAAQAAPAPGLVPALPAPEPRPQALPVQRPLAATNTPPVNRARADTFPVNRAQPGFFASSNPPAPASTKKSPFDNSDKALLGLQPKPGPGDNISTRNVRGTTIYTNEMTSPQDQAQYGKAIISGGRGLAGATKAGFDQDIKTRGQGVWDPATGRGVTFGSAKNPGQQLSATQAATNAFASGTQAGRDGLAREADLNAIRQWAGQPEYTPITETQYSQVTIPGQPESRQTMPDMRNQFQRGQAARGGMAYETKGKPRMSGLSQPPALVVPATPSRQETRETTNYIGGIHRAPRPDWMSDQLDMPRLGEEYETYRQRKLAPAMATQQQQAALGLEYAKAAGRSSGAGKSANPGGKALAEMMSNAFNDPLSQGFGYSLANRLTSQLGMDPYQAGYQAQAITQQLLTPEVLKSLSTKPPEVQQQYLHALLQQAFAPQASIQ